MEIIFFGEGIKFLKYLIKNGAEININCTLQISFLNANKN